MGLSLFSSPNLLTARGQQLSIQHPYNPDVQTDNDEYIAKAVSSEKSETQTSVGFLAQFGQDFQPAPVLIDSVDLLSSSR